MNKGEIIKNSKVVDLFCGIGGLTYGLGQSGLKVIAGYDIDESCRFAYEANNRNSIFISDDIKKVKSLEIKKHFENSNLSILVGCAPCQPFSSYSYKGKLNEKWILLYEFLRIIRDVNPSIISMENVARLLNFPKAPIFQDFLEGIEALGYHTWFEVVNCADYGMPQLRKRLVLLASKFGPISLIKPTHSKLNYVTVRDVIGHLPIISHGKSNSQDFIHRSNKLSPLNEERIMNTPEGGGWKDWDEKLKLKCHKKQSGKSYTSVYGRMRWDKPSPTITTHCTGYGNGRFGHPVQNRAISLREAAILQGFPESYLFCESENDLNIRRLSTHLGNAVPVRLGKIIGDSIIEHLKQF